MAGASIGTSTGALPVGSVAAKADGRLSAKATRPPASPRTAQKRIITVNDPQPDVTAGAGARDLMHAEAAGEAQAPDLVQTDLSERPVIRLRFE
jgi:hypothetical protein